MKGRSICATRGVKGFFGPDEYQSHYTEIDLTPIPTCQYLGSDTSSRKIVFLYQTSKTRYDYDTNHLFPIFMEIQIRCPTKQVCCTAVNLQLHPWLASLPRRSTVTNWRRAEDFFSVTLIFTQSPISRLSRVHAPMMCKPITSNFPKDVWQMLIGLQMLQFTFLDMWMWQKHAELFRIFPAISSASRCPSASLTRFQLQVDARRRHPHLHGDQDRLDQRRVLPDVRQQPVEAVNAQGLHHQRGDVDSFAAGHVVTQRHVVRAAVLALHLRQAEGAEGWGRESQTFTL